jgi:hypothetical protein
MPTIEAPTYDPAAPKPTFTHRAYGVEVDMFGEDGGMVASGHVPDLRVIAAWNHYARTEFALVNVWDDPLATLDQVRSAIVRVWAVPVRPDRDEFQWAVRWNGITEDTPGAIPLTVLWI